MTTRIGWVFGFVFVGVSLALAGCKKEGQAPTQSASTQAAATTPIKVGAIFAVTGPASFLGAPEQKTAEMLVEKINREGGILGSQIKLIVKDSGAKPETCISFAKQLMEEEKVLAIIGPSTSGETMAIKNLCQEGKTLLISCAAAENIVNPIASYVFKSPQKDSDAARRILQVLKDKGIAKVGVITSNDGFGIAGKAQLDKLAPEFNVSIAISETYDKQATDLTDVLTKLKGQDIGAVINWSIVPAQSLVAKNMKQIGLNVPLFQSHGFGNTKYAQAAGEAANGTIFPCGRLLVADVLPADHPQKKVLSEYKKDYEARFNEDVSTFGGHAYDALLLLTEAVKKAGSADSAKVRDALEELKGVVGTAGVFNLSPQDHNGLTLNDFEMLTVQDGKFLVYKN